MIPRASLLSLILLASPAMAQTTGPTPTTTPSTQPAVQITPAAQAILDRIKTTYAEASPLTVEARIAGDFDIAGRQATRRLEITGGFDGKGRFVHEAKGVGRVVHTGQRVYLYDQRQNAYATLTYSPTRQPAEDLSDDVFDILIDENPSLLMTLTTEPDKLLARDATSIDADAGSLILKNEHETRTLQFRDDGLIRAMTIDYAPLLKQRGASDIKRALVTLTYTRVERVAPGDEAFAFTAPKGAGEMQLPEELMREKIEEMKSRLHPPGASTQPATGPASGPITAP